MRQPLAIVCLFVIQCSASQAQYVGGETVYIDPDSEREETAPGIRLHLVSGAYDAKMGLPDDSRVLDQDLSASPSTGDAVHDRATFVLVSRNSVHKVVTILYYPWSPDGKQTSGFLSRIVTPKVTEKDGVLRAKARLNCAPTNATIKTGRHLTAAIRSASIASQMSRVLGYNREIRQENLKRELRIIVSMIDQERRTAIVDRMLETISHTTDSSLRAINNEAFIEVLKTDDQSLFETRQEQTRLWEKIRQTDPLSRSFDEVPQ